MATMYEDARLCHRETQAFFDLIKDELAIKDFLSVTESALIYPYGVNLAISCELSLKTFFFLKGKEPPRTHMLYAELFDRLSPSEKVASRQLIEPNLLNEIMYVCPVRMHDSIGVRNETLKERLDQFWLIAHTFNDKQNASALAAHPSRTPRF